MIFENNNYNSFIYISTIFVLLLLLFNFAEIIEDKNVVKTIKDKRIKNLITGLAIENIEDNNSKKIYSSSSYLIYYIMVFGLGIIILFLVFKYMLPLTKEFT